MPNFLKAEVDILTRLKNELSQTLMYHSYFHTLDVMNAAMEIGDAEKITLEEQSLLRVAVAYHDAGFVEVYKNHEAKGCEYAKQELPLLDFSEQEIKLICGMIMATKIPQQPNTKLEKIIADADLDYLGRNDYNHISHKLFQELQLQDILKDEDVWRKVQEDFISSHTYHTNFSKQHREPVKRKNLTVITEPIF